VRWADRLREEGTDPDPRFTFANERTFLAWVRTALALIAGGIGLEAFVPELAFPGVRQALACGLVLLGVLVSATAFRRWERSERALRTGASLPVPWLAPLLAYGIAAAAIAGVVLLVVARR
jgi:putative membrane protein